MTSFDERENLFETKFAHDEEMKFKAEARANKMLALWAAGLMDKPAEAIEAYVREVIAADFKEAGDADVIAKVAGDLGDLADLDTVRAKRADFLAEAKASLAGEA